MLEVTQLSKSFDGFLAVNRVSFAVAEGEILGLIGPNGSGKSTTFNVIAGLYAPSGGSVRFLGEEIGGLDRKSTRLNSSHLKLSRMPSSA